MKKSMWFDVFFVLGLCICISGCKAPPGRHTEFIDSSIMTKCQDLPFHSAWIKEGVELSKYEKVYIAPVNTTYILFDEKDWWKYAGKSYSDLKKDVEKIGIYMREAFINAYKDDPDKRFKVVNVPDAKTFIVELAIIELSPNKPYLKLARFAPFGGGAAASIANETTLSTVAFESRIRDNQTGKVIAMFADREQEKKYLLTTKNWTWYAHAEEIMRDWAKQFVELSKRHPGEIIKDSSTFELNPF